MKTAHNLVRIGNRIPSWVSFVAFVFSFLVVESFDHFTFIWTLAIISFAINAFVWVTGD